MSFLRIAFLVLAVIFMLGNAADAYTWSSCSNDAPLLVKDVVLDPADVSRGQPLAVRIITELGADKPQLTGGTLAASVSYLGFKVFSTSNDLCTTVACPVQPGPVTISTTQNMPGWAPRGTYKLRFEGKGQMHAASSSSSTSAHDSIAQATGVESQQQTSTSSSNKKRLLMSTGTAATAQYIRQSSRLGAGREVVSIAAYEGRQSNDDVTLVCVDVEFDMH